MEKTVFAADAFAGKTVLISGGTSGIGLAAAETFLRAGACVMIMGRDEKRGNHALAVLSAEERVRFFAGDVRRRSLQKIWMK